MPRAAPALEGVEQHGRGLLEGRRLLHPHPRLGDHAEDPLGADQQPVRARARAGAGQAPALPRAGGRERTDRLDEVVDVRVQRGEVAAGAGGDPAAQRRVLERLRVVAQGQAVLAQPGLELRPGGAGLDAGGARDRVHLEHAVQRLEVDAHGGVLGHAGLHAAHHAGAAAEGDRRGARVGAPGQQLLELALVARVGHHVGRVVEAAAKGAHHVAVGAAVAVQGALVGIAAADAGQRRRRRQPRRAQLEVLEARRALHLGRPEAEMLARGTTGLNDLVVGRLLVLVAPAPELPAAFGHGRATLLGWDVSKSSRASCRIWAGSS